MNLPKAVLCNPRKDSAPVIQNASRNVVYTYVHPNIPYPPGKP